MKLILGIGALTVLFASEAGAQKNCKKGIPCGNSCISPTKTCHVGLTPAPSSGRSTSGADTLLSDGSPIPLLPRRSTGTQPVTSHPDWIGSVDGTIYYARSCLVARQKIAEDEAIYFKTEEEAQLAGYRRSKAKGC